MAYSNPKVQAAADNIRNVIIPGFAQVAADMRATIELGKRSDDKPTPLTPAQQARIEANRGKHIYGTSHPNYTVES